MYKILLVEDDIDICEIIRMYMSRTDNLIYMANTAQEALQMVNEDSFDLILLDIMLPDITGIDLCSKLRKDLLCPIIFISCIDDDETIVMALEMGGDDYIVKPFSCSVLLARIEANMRRVRMETKNLSDKNKIVLDDFTIESSDYTVVKDGNKINLTPIEFKILTYMVSNPDRVITLEELYQNIWNEPSFDDVRTVKVHVSNLRKKVEDDPSNPKHFKTVRKIGYIFQ
ncbi:MAG: response regulator transcription factor [Sedimentibacter sp.]|uniref:response regulator transcription factor n=1 Tax=Sedimentibacter sp. TaxID=1960295 RepID=UPI003158A927